MFFLIFAVFKKIFIKRESESKSNDFKFSDENIEIKKNKKDTFNTARVDFNSNEYVQKNLEKRYSSLDNQMERKKRMKHFYRKLGKIFGRKLNDDNILTLKKEEKNKFAQNEKNNGENVILKNIQLGKEYKRKSFSTEKKIKKMFESNIVLRTKTPKKKMKFKIKIFAYMKMK